MLKFLFLTILILSDHVFSMKISNKCDISMDYSSVHGNCNQFQRCDNGEIIIMNCPSSLVWDASIKTCNYPENVAGPCGNSHQNYPTNSYYNTQKTIAPSTTTTITTTTKSTSTPQNTPYRTPMKYFEKILNYLIESD
ncbi:unnamed protein product [Brachionus calyciflorus]|uniref:Chitin-binding type-2 domain-containing protein n=1 Tax=Brachionus calyciflorus TaxID=104777 RepID=A0A813PQF7_9BILA|nr:unnamed protein product [Brachionus calyciflorus]